MQRGFGRGYGRFGRGYRGGYGVYRGSGLYSLVDLLILLGILYFIFKLFVVAAPYAIGLAVLLLLRAFLRSGPGWFGPF